MIEILEHGTHANDDAPREELCDECGCRFTHTREDCWWDRCLLTYHVECPECKADIQIGDVYNE